MTYRAGAVSTAALEGIAANCERLLQQAKDAGDSMVTVCTYDLDALLDLLRQRGNVADLYRRMNAP